MANRAKGTEARDEHSINVICLAARNVARMPGVGGQMGRHIVYTQQFVVERVSTAASLVYMEIDALQRMSKDEEELEGSDSILRSHS